MIENDIYLEKLRQMGYDFITEQDEIHAMNATIKKSHEKM